MARGKKKENLTPEERLQAALVPDWEQPYKVPENWCWTRGSAFLKPMETKRPQGEKFRYIDIDAIDNKKQQVTAPKILPVKNAPSRASRKLQTGDTVFSMVRPYLMNIAYIDDSISDSIASTGFYVCTPTENVNTQYLYYLMTSPYTVEGLNQYMKGDNSPSIRKYDIENYAYPIPPLPEQQRIVDRIESLFTKLDEAKQKAQDALDSFETRKAATLHKAFTGELTALWRKEHGVEMESWEDNSLGKFLQPLESKKPQGEEFRYIDIDSIDNINQVVREPKKILVKNAPSRANRGLKTNDVVFSMVRPYLKNIAYIDERLSDCIASTGFYVCRCKQDLSPRYLYYFLCSKDAIDYLMQYMKGDNSPSIRKNDLLEMPVSFPMIPEQTEIIRILDDLLAKEHKAKEAAGAVLEQIDLVKKSILARAFRGELGTNDPTEESAVELVKEVIEKSIENDNIPKPRAKRIVIPNSIKSSLLNDNEEEIVKLLMKSAPQPVSVQTIMSISKKKFELMDALRNLEQKQIVMKNSFGEYLLKG